MREIPLSNSAKTVAVDDADFALVASHVWRLTNRGYAATDIAGDRPLMHRLILGLPKGWPHVDHVDHNGLNNQRSNIRIATRNQNKQNERKRPGCTSVFKGVAWNKAAKKWRTQIEHNGRKLQLGFFADEVAAARAYNDAATRLFGEFALLNVLETENENACS